jgi:hypothetical protein
MGGFLDNVFGKRSTPQAPDAILQDPKKLNEQAIGFADTNIQAGRDLSNKYDPGAVEARKRYEKFVLEDDARGGLIPSQIADSVRSTLSRSGASGTIGSSADLFSNARDLGLNEWQVMNERKNRLANYGFNIQPERQAGITKDDLLNIDEGNVSARNQSALQQWQVDAANATTPTFLEGLTQGAVTRSVNLGFDMAESAASSGAAAGGM